MPFPREDEPATWQQVISLNCFHCGGGRLAVTGTDTYSGYGFVFSVCSASNQPQHLSLQNALLIVPALACRIPLHLITEHFRAKDVQQWVHACVPLNWQALTEKWNSLLKTWLHELRDTMLKGRCSTFKMQYILWIKDHYIVLLPKAGKHSPGNQGVEAGLVLFTFTPTNLPAEYLLPILPTLGSADLGGTFALGPVNERRTQYLVI